LLIRAPGADRALEDRPLRIVICRLAPVRLITEPRRNTVIATVFAPAGTVAATAIGAEVDRLLGLAEVVVHRRRDAGALAPLREDRRIPGSANVGPVAPEMSAQLLLF